jgi:hypothetical protein
MNTDGAKDNVGEKPGYIYEISAELGNQRNFSVRGNFPVGATAGYINVELDKLLKAIGRQQARSCLAAEKSKLSQMERQALAFEKRMAVDFEKYKGHKTLPQQAKLDQETVSVNLAEQRSQLLEQKARISELEKEAE